MLPTFVFVFLEFICVSSAFILRARSAALDRYVHEKPTSKVLFEILSLEIHNN
jgi:hypothetical protein